MWLVRRGKGNKQKSLKTSLATNENQDISYDRLFDKPTLVYSGSLPYLIHKGSSLATFQMNLPTVCFLLGEGSWWIPISNLILIKRNQNVELFHVFECAFS